MNLFKTAMPMVLGALVAITISLGGDSANASTISFTPDASDPGAVELDTIITIPGDPSGGTLSFNLTLGANYSLADNSGANGSFNLQLDTQSTPFWSLASLTATPSTAGTIDYGDQTSFWLVPDNISDTSLWSVNIAAGDFPVTLTIDSQFTGYCPDVGTCYAPAATFSYDFAPNGVTSAVPEPSTWVMMILGMTGVGFGARRRRHFLRVAPSPALAS